MQQIRNALPERNIVTDSTHVASPDEGGGALCVGVLALQGDFREHRKILDVLGATTVLVRTPEDLEAVDALILPGGESTTIARLIRSSGLWDPLVARLAAGMPAWGTCAGAILLALAAFWAPVVGTFPTIFDYFQQGWAIMAAPITVVFLLGALWKRATNRAAITTLGVGIACIPLTFWLEKRVLPPGFNFYNLVGLLFLAQLALMMAVSLATPPPGDEVVRTAVWSTRLAGLPPE